MLESTVKAVEWGRDWEIDHVRKSLTLNASNLEHRNQIIHNTLIREREKGTFKLLRKWSNEVSPVYGSSRELVMSIERVAAPLFGIVTYGVQLLAYQEHTDGPRVWIARRAITKRTFPGMLDSTVGGSMRTGEQPFECVVREAEEEASLPSALTRELAAACGTINYSYLTDERSGGEVGCYSPQVQFIYEMKVPHDVVPVPGDDEAEEFTLMTVIQLKGALAKGDFTPANGCVVLDFFIRHGILTFENEPAYIEIASRLHRVLDLLTA